uniref:Suppressor of fused domain protein n=1 Tax=Schlesneria paludicola TaxID=360056 RepID=A0A7C2PGT8_9PLAN
MEVPNPNVIRHTERRQPFAAAVGNGERIEQISDHIERHIGPVANVFHEIVSDLVHIDLHVVNPAPERNHYTLITSGMSDLPMAVPETAADFALAELVIALPADWPMDMQQFEKERHYWPLRWLKMLARMPHEYQTWLCFGHTVPNGDPPQPFADNTEMCCMLLGFPLTAPEEFQTLPTDQGVIRFWGLYPLYESEMEFKLSRGSEALFDRLDNAGVTELLVVGRENVCEV